MKLGGDCTKAMLYGWARWAGLQESDAADLGQEVFRTVASRFAQFRRDRPGDTFRGWLWGIACGGTS